MVRAPNRLDDVMIQVDPAAGISGLTDGRGPRPLAPGDAQTAPPAQSFNAVLAFVSQSSRVTSGDLDRVRTQREAFERQQGVAKAMAEPDRADSSARKSESR